MRIHVLGAAAGLGGVEGGVPPITGYVLTTVKSNPLVEGDRLQAFLRTSQSNLQQNTTVRQQVDKITGSMGDFERNWLANPSSGRMSLYATLNDLIKSNGLRNTAGPTYTPLDPIGSKGQVQPTTSAEKQSNAKWQTIYPGIAVSVTVEGPYQRHQPVHLRQLARVTGEFRQRARPGALVRRAGPPDGVPHADGDRAARGGRARPDPLRRGVWIAPCMS